MIILSEVSQEEKDFKQKDSICLSQIYILLMRSMKLKQTHGRRTDLWLPRGTVEEGWIGSLGLATANSYI